MTSVAVTGSSGTTTVALNGTGVQGHAQLTVDPGALDFGTVPVGSPATRTLKVSNTGNLDVTITKAAPPTLPFVVNTPLPEGQVLTPGDDIEIQVTFAPTTAGDFTNKYLISSDDGGGAHTVAVTESGPRILTLN